MTGHDRQWALNRRNFEGRWCGVSHWYRREPGEGAAQGPLDLDTPRVTIADTCYEISFSDPQTGLWDGRGLLLAPGGVRRLPLSRDTYNRAGRCWQFHGAGGQSSLAVDDGQPRFGHEVNLFHGRSRSMLVLLWDRDPDGWRLQTVGAVAFRCTRAPVPDPPRPPAHDWREALREVEGWPGTTERLVPGAWPERDPRPRPCAPFRPAMFSGQGRMAGFADGLLCSLPERLPGGAFSIQVGGRLAADRFRVISIHFDPRGRLSCWEMRRFRPPPAAAGR